MNSERFRQIDQLFEQALELPEGERGAFLDGACGGDTALRRSVDELLAADDSARGFLDGSPLGPAILGPGTTIGPYRIERLLGRGGMGTVYLARRPDVDRPVALKLVEASFRHPDLVPRFHAERQILARLEHPAIARLYDAGETAEGVPYLVLEYVDGEPLDEYCDRRRLSLAARVELLRKLCDAVAHAHQNLLVHRDIKPANVLVTADGEPKLLDFGIAKRLSDPGSAVSLTRARPMTPTFASPEQVRGEPVTTATDIYSLGVVLYGLLAGRSPYRLESGLAHELDAAILSQEPEKPSAAIDRPAQPPVVAEIAAARSATPAELRRTLSGDLDTIALAALRKDPARRYRSVLELAADLDRWRNDLPIAARPDSAGYRLGKFVRRHRAGVAAGVLVALSTAGLVVSLFEQRDRATRERDRARDALRFVVEVFERDSPYQQGQREVTAREILAQAAGRAERELGHEPDLQAALFRAVGQATAGIGHYDDALPLLAKSLTHDRELHPVSTELAASLEAAGWVEFLRDDFASALPHLEEAVALRRRIEPGSAELARSLFLLGTVLSEQALREEKPETDRIEALFQEALALNERLEGAESKNATSSRSGLVKVARLRGELGKAEELARRVLAANLDHFGPDHPETAASQRGLGLILLDQARAAEAEPLFREALATLDRTLPADHPEIATAASDLGLMLNSAGRATEAEPHLRRAYELTRARLGDGHRNTLTTLGILASVVQNLGRSAESVPLRERCLEGEIAVFGEKSLPVAQTMSMLARALAVTGDFERAERLARQSLAIREEILPPGHPEFSGAYRHLGAVLLRVGKPVDAEPYLRKSLDDQRRTQGPEAFQTAGAEITLGSCLLKLGRLDEAAPLIEHGTRVLDAKFPPDHPLVQEAHKKTEELAAARGQGAEAEG